MPSKTLYCCCVAAAACCRWVLPLVTMSAKVQAQQGTIIVFLGNESPLGTPSQPIVFEQARDMNALVLQVEHRWAVQNDDE